MEEEFVELTVYSPGDLVRFECNPGYTLNDSRPIQCRDDRTWNPPVPVCLQHNEAVSPSSSHCHGKAGVRASDVFSSGMSVTYHCDPGYSLLRESSVHCTEYRAWSCLLPQCEARCMSPVVENGRTNGVQASYRPRDVVLFECDPGYTLNGSTETQCQEDGGWDPSLPICERSEKKALAAGSYNFLSEALGIMGGMLLLLLVIQMAVSKMTTGYYYTHENKYEVLLTHVIEQKTSFAP